MIKLPILIDGFFLWYNFYAFSVLPPTEHVLNCSLMWENIRDYLFGPVFLAIDYAYH